MENDIGDLNNKSSLAYKFKLEIDGIDKEWIAKCVLPTFSFNERKVGDIANKTHIQVSSHFNAAGTLISWIQNFGSTRSAKLSILSNDDKDFITFYLPICKLDFVDFGVADYKSEEPILIHFQISCFDTRFDVK